MPVKRITNTQPQAPGTATAQRPTAQGTPPASQPPTGNSFPQMTQSDIRAMLAAQKQLSTPASRQAVKDYVNPAQQSNGYGISQNLNHAMSYGQQLTPKQQAIKDGLQSIMVPIGVETTLHRADHDSVLKALGINNYQQLTGAQLKKQLVGRTITTKEFWSTSHDPSKNPFLPGGIQGGGREVHLIIHTSKTTRGALIQSSQAEILLDAGTNVRVTGVRYTGQTAHPRVGGAKKVVEIEVEVW